ncbi:MAG: hypothetical protein HY583_01350 [Candidatus Omnitrophica bacterium]|nr:hypothetical protein [Candidatus Omnitrophota bacterium]
MIKFKKLPILILILPLVITSILLASCFCPQAEAASLNQTAIESHRHVCCPDSAMDCSRVQPSDFLNSQITMTRTEMLSFPRKRESRFPIKTFGNDSFSLAMTKIGFQSIPLDSSSFQPQGNIFLKNEVLRI